jgi:hypothetical protein
MGEWARPRAADQRPPGFTVDIVRPFLFVLLVVFALWIAITVVGFIVKGLFWLAVVGLLCAAGTAAIGTSRRR